MHYIWKLQETSFYDESSWRSKELLWVFLTFILQIKVNETNRKESQGIFTNPSKKITSDKILKYEESSKDESIYGI